MQITLEHINNYQTYLYHQERSQATIEKYIRDIKAYISFLDNQSLSKESLYLKQPKTMRDYICLYRQSVPQESE